MNNTSKNTNNKDVNRNKKNGNKKKPNFRRNETQCNPKSNEVTVSKSNPYSWYSAFPQFTKDAGTLPFGNPLGQAITLPTGDRFYLPGLCRLSFYPTIGYSADMSSPINRSAIRFYTYLRNIQKSAARYESADIMMYLMALDSCYMFHSMMRRAYGIAQLFTPVNKYYPQKLFSLLGFDPSILDNLAEFRAYINRFAIALGSYTVPGNIDIFNRHQWMCEGLYTDSDTTRSQTYVFVPEGFWRYNNTVETGSQLDFVPWIPQDQTGSQVTLHTLADVQNFGNSLLNNILNDEDTGNISGDIYSAFGPNAVKKMVETPEGFMVLPTYDQTVLSQIENATITGKFDSSYTPVITQNPTVNNGAIVFTPTFRGSAVGYGTGTPLYANALFTAPSQMINMHKDSPSPEDVIEATRFVVAVDAPVDIKTAKSSAFTPKTFGADVIASMVIGTMVPKAHGAEAMNLAAFYTNGVYAESGSTVDADKINLLAEVSAFDWAPLLYTWNGSGEAKTMNINKVIGDVDNMTTVSFTQLNTMHEAVMLSLFDIPQMGM